MIRDIVRAVLVLVVLAVGCEILAVHRGRQAAPPTVATAAPSAWPAQPGWPAPPAWQPMRAPAATPEPGPIRRVAKEFVDLAEATIGVIR